MGKPAALRVDRPEGHPDVVTIRLTDQERRALVAPEGHPAGSVEAADLQRRSELAFRHGLGDEGNTFGTQVVALESALRKLSAGSQED